MHARARAAAGVGAPFVRASEAARTLGVSTKALRVYERAGLIRPRRSPTRWRLYGPRDLEDARGIIALRVLGVGLADIAALQGADAAARRHLLRTYQATLEARAGAVAAAVDQVNGPSPGSEPESPPEGRLRPGRGAPGQVRLTLPWPWGGERWVLRGLGPLNYITGPLGSGKTRLAQCLARAIPGGSFVGLERLDDGASAAPHRLSADARLAARVEQALSRLVADGATACRAMRALLVALHSTPRGVIVVDMIEQDLNDATQRALMRELRGWGGMPLVLMTRSTAILDLAQAKESEVIIYCPANHSVPMQVVPRQGAAGMEAVYTCLASPAVRARTADVIACRQVDLPRRPSVPVAGPPHNRPRG